MALHYDDPFWRGKLGAEMQDINLEHKLHLIFSLCIFLGVTISQYLEFIFSSKIQAVKQRAGIFMSTRTNGPGAIYNLWHTHFPRARRHLQDIVHKYVLEITLEESNKIITEPLFKIRIKELTVASVQNLLRPQFIAAKVQELAPFMWSILTQFSSAPNTYRQNKRRQAKKTTGTGDDSNEADSDPDWDDDPNDDTCNPGPEHPSERKEGFARNPVFAVLLSIMMLAFVRNQATNVLALILGLFFKTNGTSSRVIKVLSNVGLSVSGTTIERLKERISDDAIAHAIQLLTSNTLCALIFDNINIYLRKFQQRLTNQNSMIHATNAAIIAINPEGIDVEAAQNLKARLDLRGARNNAKPDDILPSRADDQHMALAFQSMICLLITRYCPGSDKWEGRAEMLENIRQSMPEDRPQPVEKTDARPFGVFDVNEGSKVGIVNVFEAMQKRSTLSEEEWSSINRVSLGDWLTSNNTRAARSDRVDDVTPMDRLEYLDELSTLWHYALQNTHLLMRAHYGHEVRDPTSLAAHKNLLGRKWDVKKPNYAAAKSLIRHSLIARLLYIVMHKKGLKLWSELTKWQPTLDKIQDIARDIQESYASTTAAQKAKDEKDDWQAHMALFMRDALFFCEFEDAVSYADPGRVLRVMRYWCLAYRGAGQHNYARECAEVLLKWAYETTDASRAVLERAWFFNRWAEIGRSIATDLYLEQLNYWVKRVFIASGNGVTIEYIMKKGSACIEAFREITHLVANFFGYADRSRRSKEARFQEDLRVLGEHMIATNIYGRTTEEVRFVAAPIKVKPGAKKTPPPRSAVVDVLVVGAESWQDGKWKDFLKSSTFDPALGYPISDERSQETSRNTDLDNDTVFDNVNENPLAFDAQEDLFGDEEDGVGGALGGGGEYSTGEIDLQ